MRIEAIELEAAPNEHPVAIDVARVRVALQSFVLPGDKNQPLFNADELAEIEAPLARALARATPQQDVCFAVSGQHGNFAPLSPRLVTTARVFQAGGRLNFVFGLVRHDWDSQFKATGAVIAFEPGHRARSQRAEAKVAADAARGDSLRADWVALGNLSSPPAPTAAQSAAADAKAAAAPASAPQVPAAAAPVPPSAAPPSAPAQTAKPGNYENIAERLRTLQKLRDEGLITQQEYEEKRREILKDL